MAGWGKGFISEAVASAHGIAVAMVQGHPWAPQYLGAGEDDSEGVRQGVVPGMPITADPVAQASLKLMLEAD